MRFAQSTGNFLVGSLALLVAGCGGVRCAPNEANAIVRSFASDPGKGLPEVFSSCLDANANPNSTGATGSEPDGWTPILLTAYGNAGDAGRQGNDSIWNAASLEQARLLLEHGADVRATTPEGENAVYLSAKAGRVPLIQFFLSKGVPVDEPTRSGKTALFESITYARTDIAELLLKHGANPNQLSEEKMSALDYAEMILRAAEGSGTTSAPGYDPAGMIELLRKHGAKTAAQLGVE